MQSSDLALPTGWTPPRPAVWRAVDTIVIVVGVFMIVGGIQLVGTDEWHSGVAFGLLGLVLGAAVVLRRRRDRALDDAPVDTVKGALRIGFSRVALVQGLAVTLVGAASAALFTVAAWEARNWVPFVAGATTAAACAVVVGVRCRLGITVGELRLSPHDLRLRVDDRDLTVPWEDLVGLSTSETTSSYGIVTGRLLALHVRTPPRGRRPRPSTGDIRVPIRRIDLDEVVLHHLLRFYHQHPEARGELAGPAAVARLRDRAFPA